MAGKAEKTLQKSLFYPHLQRKTLKNIEFT